MIESDRYADPPARVNILPGFVNIADAVSLIRAAASRRDPGNRVSSASELRMRAQRDAKSGRSGWNAAWHTLRQGLLEGSIAALECDHRGRVAVLTPEFWRELFDAPADESDAFGLRHPERTEPSPFKDWRSPSSGGRYVVDQSELQGFIANEFSAMSADRAPTRSRRGRKKVFDEVAIISEAANIMLVKPRARRPRTREKLIEELLTWYALNYPQVPDRNTIQPWVSQFWDHLDFDND